MRPFFHIMLRELAAQGASGALEVAGESDGYVYLADDELAFAESPAVPGLAERLVNSRLLSPREWNGLAAAASGAAGDAGQARAAARKFVRAHCRITFAHLEAVTRSAVADAILGLGAGPAAGGPDPDPDHATFTNFSPGRWHWAGSLTHLDVAGALDEAERRRRKLASYSIGPDARMALRGSGRRWPILDREQWLVACLADGSATIRELAWRHGLALYETIEQVGELIADGLCAVSDTAGPDRPERLLRHLPGAARPTPSAAPAAYLASPAGPAGTTGLPARAGARRAALPRRAPAIRPGAAGIQAPPASLDVLRQVLDGLRRLD